MSSRMIKEAKEKISPESSLLEILNLTRQNTIPLLDLTEAFELLKSFKNSQLQKLFQLKVGFTCIDEFGQWTKNTGNLFTALCGILSWHYKKEEEENEKILEILTYLEMKTWPLGEASFNKQQNSLTPLMFLLRVSQNYPEFIIHLLKSNKSNPGYVVENHTALTFLCKEGGVDSDLVILETLLTETDDCRPRFKHETKNALQLFLENPNFREKFTETIQHAFESVGLFKHYSPTSLRKTIKLHHSRRNTLPPQKSPSLTPELTDQLSEKTDYFLKIVKNLSSPWVAPKFFQSMYACEYLSQIAEDFPKVFVTKICMEIKFQSFFSYKPKIILPSNLSEVIQTHDYIIMPLRFKETLHKKDISHLNLVFIDVKKKKYERFEPHGDLTICFGIPAITIDEIFLTKISKYLPGFTYIPPLAFCPSTGPQKQMQDKIGYCNVISILYGHLRIMNLQLRKKQIVDFIIKLVMEPFFLDQYVVYLTSLIPENYEAFLSLVAEEEAAVEEAMLEAEELRQEEIKRELKRKNESRNVELVTKKKKGN